MSHAGVFIPSSPSPGRWNREGGSQIFFLGSEEWHFNCCMQLSRQEFGFKVQMRKHKWERHLAMPILPPLVDAVFIRLPSFISRDHPAAVWVSSESISAVSSVRDGFYHLWYLLILCMSASLTSLLDPWSRDLNPSSSLSDIAWCIPGDKKYLKDEILPDLPSGASWKGYLLLAEVGH